MDEGKNAVPCGFRKVTPEEKKRLVGGHFERIAPRYDLADAVLSFALHHHWRRFAIRRLGLAPGDRVLDLCGGTADLAVIAARHIAPRGTVVVCDASRAMMLAGRSKVKRSGHGVATLLVQGDAENLGLGDGVFDAVTIGFGVRNIARLEAALAEIRRVLKTGGKLMILEFSVPEARWIRGLYAFYSFRIMPFVGRALTGAAEPYRYLAESIRAFPPPETLKSSLEEAGFTNVALRRLAAGIVAVYLCERGELRVRPGTYSAGRT